VNFTPCGSGIGLFPIRDISNPLRLASRGDYCASVPLQPS
jgi:hypothetical protein